MYFLFAIYLSVASAQPGDGHFVAAALAPDHISLNSSVFSFRNYETGAACGAVRVGAGGESITAAHCFKECLEINGWFDRQEDALNSRGNRLTIFRHSGAAPQTIECKTSVPQAVVTVISGPRCLAFVQNAPGEPERVAESAPGNCDKSKDILLVRFPEATVREQKCAPLASAVAPPGSAVFSIGFPTATANGESDGQGLYRSYGHLVHQGYCVWTGDSGARLLSTLPFELGPDVLQTTVNAVPRSSGSPLFDASGAVIGVASGIYSRLQSAASYCAGGVFFANLNSLELTPQILEENKKCLSSSF